MKLILAFLIIFMSTLLTLSQTRPPLDDLVFLYGLNNFDPDNVGGELIHVYGSETDTGIYADDSDPYSLLWGDFSNAGDGPYRVSKWDDQRFPYAPARLSPNNLVQSFQTEDPRPTTNLTTHAIDFELSEMESEGTFDEIDGQNALTIYILFQTNNPVGSKVLLGYFDANPVTEDNTFRIGFLDGQFNVTQYGVNGQYNTQSVAITDTDFHIVTVVFDRDSATQTQLFLDGVEQTSVASNNPITTPFGLYKLKVGAKDLGTEFLDGSIKDIIGFRAAHNRTQIADWNNFLNSIGE